jgi:hypothetical protein
LWWPRDHDRIRRALADNVLDDRANVLIVQHDDILYRTVIAIGLCIAASPLVFTQEVRMT